MIESGPLGEGKGRGSAAAVYACGGEGGADWIGVGFQAELEAVA